MLRFSVLTKHYFRLIAFAGKYDRIYHKNGVYEIMMWLWIIATAVAYFIKGLCGFANTLVFTSILGFGSNNVNISPVELVLGYPTNFILTWKNRKYLRARVYLPLIALVLAGSVAGALMLKNIDARLIKIIFGMAVIFIGIEMLFHEIHTNSKRNTSGQGTVSENTVGLRVFLIVVGILSGVLCGLFGVGALLTAYVSRVTDSNDSFKANISAVFIAENTFRIVVYSVLGIINVSCLKQALVLIPFMLVGLFCGMKSSQLLDEHIVKRIVIGLLILSGIVLVIKNVV